MWNDPKDKEKLYTQAQKKYQTMKQLDIHWRYKDLFLFKKKGNPVLTSIDIQEQYPNGAIGKNAIVLLDSCIYSLKVK